MRLHPCTSSDCLYPGSSSLFTSGMLVTRNFNNINRAVMENSKINYSSFEFAKKPISSRQTAAPPAVFISIHFMLTFPPHSNEIPVYINYLHLPHVRLHFYFKHSSENCVAVSTIYPDWRQIKIWWTYIRKEHRIKILLSYKVDVDRKALRTCDLKLMYY